MIREPWKNKKVFVTGADGFIGSHLVEALSAAGAKVTALAQYNSFDQAGWLDEIEPTTRSTMHIVRGDIRDSGQMMQLARGQETIFHLAALIAIPYSYEAPASFVQTNIHGTLNLLNAARDANVNRVIHTSTSEVYGTAIYTPIDEAHPLQGHSPYSASKAAADLLVESFFRSFDLPVVTIRPFNTYGPRQSERAVIPSIIRQIIDPSCKTICVGDLSPSRDFNFIDDTVAAFMAVGALPPSKNGEVFNAGSGRMVSIADTLKLIKDISGTRKKIINDKVRHRPENSEVMALKANAAKLSACSQWKPIVSLEAGIKKTLSWWADRIDKARIDSGYIK